jgi:hypothetical protein
MLFATGSLFLLLLRGLPPLLLLLCLSGMPLLLARVRIVVGLFALTAAAIASEGTSAADPEATGMMLAAGCCLLREVLGALGTAVEAAGVLECCALV